MVTQCPAPATAARERSEKADRPSSAAVWPGVEAVNQQGGTGYAGPKAGMGVARHVVGRPQADILIEFPSYKFLFVLFTPCSVKWRVCSGVK